ncbi:hypothetical protein FHS18_005199 [Paenibacillus phyllosphaerae]|uniref:Uncharacterized protein n=1 Tax=Paenibacillus phyllosphaerae TaxID=274593 RepID=A0A7W5FQ45_9BACL|nr:hypothetical protein [Paenibacillus phyllosphaerae]
MRSPGPTWSGAGPGSNGVVLSIRAYNAEGGGAGQFMIPLVFADPTYLYLSSENETGIVRVESDLRSFAATGGSVHFIELRSE